jgi:beta-galactosidase
VYRNIIILYSLIFLVGCSDLHHHPERIGFNSGWQFIRLGEDVKLDTKHENQGSDWLSQYDVTHVSSGVNLPVPKEVLKDEFSQLEKVNWEDVTLPHSPRIEDLTVVHQWQGISYYKKRFIALKNWSDKRCFLEFEGAMQLADIWINGRHILQHAGGYTPFVIDLTGYLKFGETNEILVRLDNRDNPLIPPGKPLEKLDFCYYGGIYRDVNLVIKKPVHITDPVFANETAGGGVFVTYPEVSQSKAIISVKTQVINESETPANIIVVQRLFIINGLFGERKTGKEVAKAETKESLKGCEAKHTIQKIELENPKLWSPDAPWLYLLRTEIVENGEIVDFEEQRIGIRRISFSRENGFEINGQKVRLVGTNRHQEYPYVGNAIPDRVQYRDIYHIKESGFNTVRLGHYLQDKSVLDACDELGILAIEPIPGWQFFNDNEQFCNLTYRDIRYMIRRDRNHPSIVMWEVILNESWPPKWWKDNAAEIAHSEYPGNQCYTSGDSYGYFGWDVQYNDWEEGFNRPNNSGKPGFIREYYDYEFGGHYSTTRVSRGDGEKALLQNVWNAQWSHNRYRAYYPWTSGDAVWSLYDYNRGCCDNICRSGVADIFRIDKFSIPFFKSQMAIGTPLPTGKFKPYIFIANYWDNRPEDDKVVVYANVDEVSILINGKEFARQKCDAGPDTDYAKDKELWYKGGHPFDGGNCLNLNLPPFTFNDIRWQSGKLEAIGYLDRKEVCRNIVRTPDKPAANAIDYFESGKPASTDDLIIVYVEIEDKSGTLCVNDTSNVTLAVTGGEVIGPATMAAEAGIASFLVKTGVGRQLKLEVRSHFGRGEKVINLR